MYFQSLERLDFGSPTHALELIDEALRLFPKNALYLTTRAECLKDLKRFDEALDSIQAAIAIQPSAKLWAALGIVHRRLGEPVEAAAALSRAVQIKEAAHYYTLLAGAQAEFDPQAARDSAEKAVSLDENWDEAWHVLGRLHQVARRHREAVACFDRAIKIDTVPPYLVSKALSEIEFDLNKAMETAERALELDPGNEEAAIIVAAVKERQFLENE